MRGVYSHPHEADRSHLFVERFWGASILFPLAHIRGDPAPRKIARSELNGLLILS